MKIFGLTDVGRKRRENEDRFLVSEEHGFAILADGMGGRNHGEVASQMVVDALGSALLNDLPPSYERLERAERGAFLVNQLDEWIRRANRSVWEKAQADERYREMGTTVVVLTALPGAIVLGHIGDSRCYRWSQHHGFTQLTEDHSLVQSQIDEGVLTEEEARESAQRNIITRAVGTAEKVKPDIKQYATRPGERFLLCSDGLSDMIEDAELEEILATPGELGALAKRLVDRANDEGGADNITVILAEVTS